MGGWKLKRQTLLIVGLTLILMASGCTPEKAVVMQKPSDSVLENYQADISLKHNQLGFDLYRALRMDGENLMISPVSISMALAMAYNGANGSTKDAMAKVMYLDGISEEQVNHNLLSLLYYLTSADEKVALTVANSSWMRDGFPFSNDYIDTIQEYFLAEARSLDFSDSKTPDTINRWVKTQTRGLIPKIVEPPINPQTILYLINAVYFKGEWTQTFDPKRTKDGNFTTDSGESITTSMMVQNGSYRYGDNDFVQIVRKPYGKEERIAMYMILPKPNYKFEDIQNILDDETWKQWKDDMVIKSGILQMPKFQLEYKQSLVSALTQLGMGIAFDPAAANFLRMAEPGLSDNIFISEVLHKTYIKVNETGTEAAAVTSVVMNLTSVPMYDFEMVLDQPFIYVIEDSVTGSILFMGHVVNPQS